MKCPRKAPTTTSSRSKPCRKPRGVSPKTTIPLTYANTTKTARGAGSKREPRSKYSSKATETAEGSQTGNQKDTKIHKTSRSGRSKKRTKPAPERPNTSRTPLPTPASGQHTEKTFPLRRKILHSALSWLRSEMRIRARARKPNPNPFTKTTRRKTEEKLLPPN